MTLLKAIEIKQVYHNCHSQQMTPEERQADNLSIEALKAVQLYRHYSAHGHLAKLPGETKH